MTTDQALGTVGLVLGVAGIALAVLYSRLPVRVAVAHEASGGAPTKAAADDDDFVWIVAIFAIAGWLILAIAAVWFTRTDRLVVLGMAVAADVLSAVGLVVLLVSLLRQRTGGALLRPLVLLFLADAVVAWLPVLFTDPLLAQSRFTPLVDLVPRTGSAQDREHAVMKTFGPGLAGHLVVQALGEAILAAAVFAVVYHLVRVGWAGRRSRGTRLRRELPTSLGGSIGVVIACIAGFALASGLAYNGLARVVRTGSWSAQTSSSWFSGTAPSVGLLRAKNGTVTVELAYCGEQRLLDLVVEPSGTYAGVDLRSPIGLPSPTQYALGRISATQLVMHIRTTRSYRTTVVLRVPAAGKWTEAGTTTGTLTAFRKAGHACT